MCLNNGNDSKKIIMKCVFNGELLISKFLQVKLKYYTRPRYSCGSKLDSKDVSRISSTFGKTNRVIIDTEDHEYIIYTQNDQKSLQ